MAAPTTFPILQPTSREAHLHEKFSASRALEEKLRLVVREYELFPGSGEAVSIAPLPATRLVYAEVLDVLLPG